MCSEAADHTDVELFVVVLLQSVAAIMNVTHTS